MSIPDQTHDLIAVPLKIADSKFVVFLKKSDSDPEYSVGATNGSEAWEGDMKTAGSSSSNVGTLREAFLAKRLKLKIPEEREEIELIVGTSEACHTVVLKLADEPSKKLMLEYLIYELAEELGTLQTSVKELENKQKTQGSSISLSHFHMETTKKSNTRLRPPQKGMSVINPKSKKLKGGQGIVFE